MLNNNKHYVYVIMYLLLLNIIILEGPYNPKNKSNVNIELSQIKI